MRATVRGSNRLVDGNATFRCATKVNDEDEPVVDAHLIDDVCSRTIAVTAHVLVCPIR